MATAQLIVDRQSVIESKDTTQIVEVYAVTGLVDPDDRKKLYEALGAVGLPALGDPHPALATALCVGRDVGAFGVSTATVQCNFEIPTSDSDNPVLNTTGIARFNASTIVERTTEDRNGVFMINSWTGWKNEVWPGLAAPTALLSWSHFVEVDINRPQWSFELSRRETSIAALAQLSEDYVGKVNAASWGVAYPIAARSALCVAIDVEVVNNGELRASYQFQFNPKTFDFTAVARVDNRIPITVDVGNGIDVFEIYDTADFDLLPVVLT